MKQHEIQESWGQPPWRIDFEPERHALPERADIAVVGAGFTGLAAAAWLRHLLPAQSVVVLEAGRIGAGSSGRTGGLVLEGTAAGDAPGLGDVLEGYARILRELEVECDLTLSGAWEIARRPSRQAPRESPIAWQDSGTLRLVHEVAGGTVEPGKLLSGVGGAAQRLGAILFENAPVRGVCFDEPLRLELSQATLHARQALFATNAMSLELTCLAGRAQPKFTMAIATAPLEDKQLEAIGLGRRMPFYTVDFPYLWGRLMADGAIIFGSGLVHLNDSRELADLSASSGQPAELLASLERRVRGLHPALRSVNFTHRWGGPILFSQTGHPFFARHPRSSNALVLAGYSGHGVALSVYLGCWAAEVLAGQKDLPAWGAMDRE